MSDTLHSPSITFIGGGNMAQALLVGLKQQGFAMANITVIDPDAAKQTDLQARLSVQTATSIDANNSAVSLIVLAVKPQQLKQVALTLAPYLVDQCVLSVAAGIRTVDLCRWLGDYHNVIRTMPNTPAQIQAGITGAYALSHVSAAHQQLASQLLTAAGEVVWLTDETHLDAVTALSGSGPAYVFLLIEAMTQAGVALGLTEAQSAQLSIATFKGASLLAASSDVPIATLRAQVTSKGGTTEQGLLSLNAAGIHDIMREATLQAAKRAQSLGDELGAQ